MKETLIEDICNLYDISFESVDSFKEKLIKTFANNGLLCSELTGANTETETALKSLIIEFNPIGAIYALLCAIPSEFELSVTYTVSQFDVSSNVNLEKFKSPIDHKYFSAFYDSNYKGYIDISMFFDCKLKEFKEKDLTLSLPVVYLRKLNQYCGVSELEIEYYFESDFLSFLNFCIELIGHNGNKDYKGFANKIIDKFNLSLNSEVIIDDESFYELFLKIEKDELIKIIEYFTKYIGDLRRLTLAPLETILTPRYIGNLGKLAGESKISIMEFSELDNLLVDLFLEDKFNVNRTVQKKVEAYLNQNYNEIKELGGFFGIIRRQHNLRNRISSKNTRPNIDEISDVQLESKVQQYENELNDLSIISRLKTIVRELEIYSDAEQILIKEKISSIINSNNPTYYSDIFELYFAHLLKRSGVDIKFLSSQTKEGNDVSTCDYSFNKVVGADSKCIISNKMSFSNISDWCKKIGSQIKSTIGYEGIMFGGGVIGMKDQNFDFLESCRNFNPKNQLMNIETIKLVNFIIELYSEFRRHTGENKEFIKFLAFYYIPSSNLTIEEIRNANIDTLEEKNEMLILMTTKYATESDIDKIWEIFKPVCPLLFTFDNRFVNC
jgi:hypothetical protein